SCTVLLLCGRRRAAGGQSTLAGGKPCLGVEDPEPTARGPTMPRQKGVVRLALDHSDEEPVEPLLRVVVRVRDGSVIARPREGHVRKDLLVHGAFDQAVSSRAPLGDDGRAVGARALEPVYLTATGFPRQAG